RSARPPPRRRWRQVRNARDGRSQSFSAPVVTSPYTTSSATVAFGVVLFARPEVGAGTLALLLGLFNLIYGGLAAGGRQPTAPHGQSPAPAGQGPARAP